MSELETVETWLRNTYNIGVSTEWLSACLEWIQQENQGQLPPTNKLTSLVFEQWLVSDLSEIAEPVLPQDVCQDKCQLVSNYPLQLISLLDIGFPLYGQKQKILGRLNANEEVSADKPFQPAWEPKPSRMLLMQLTDGHTQVQAMEYQPIRVLHTELLSGFKLLVCGPVMCRRGIIMLTPECVQLLGGEVDALMEQNTPLTNVENGMIKNREDEGKHARKEFSGKFITRGVDKKLDYDSQKTFTSKPNSWGASCAIKPQPQPQLPQPQPQRQPELPQITFKQQATFFQGKSQQPLKQELNQDEGNEDFEDCFNDDLDLAEIDSVDVSVATELHKERKDLNMKLVASSSVSAVNRFNSSTRGKDGVVSRDSDTVIKTEHGPSQQLDQSSLNFKQSSLVSSFQNKPQKSSSVKNPPVIDVDIFDDDFEMDDVSYTPDYQNSLNTERKPVGKVMPDVTPTENSPSSFLRNTIDNRCDALSVARLSTPVETSSVSNVSSKSRSIQENLEIPQKPVHTAATIFNVSNSLLPALKQNVRNDVSKLSRGKCDVQQKPNKSFGNSGQPQTKKQCKLSDMFHKNFTTSSLKQPPLDSGDDYDCTIVDDATNHRPNIELKGKGRASWLNVPSGYQSDKSGADQRSLLLKATNRFSVTAPLTSGQSSVQESQPETEGSQNQAGVMTTNWQASDQQALPSTDVDDVPFNYLSELSKQQLPGLTVKAYISTLAGKLTNNEGSHWSLPCRINDGTACLDVDLADCVLTELIGFTAKDSIVMKQRMKSEPQVKEDFFEALLKCQQQLINICCIMEVQAASATRNPMITKLVPISGRQVNQLLQRVQKQLGLSS